MSQLPSHPASYPPTARGDSNLSAGSETRRATVRIRCLALVVALLLASALALVDARPAAAAEMCFPQTNHCVRGRFLDQWQTYGGLAINGYPLTDERLETLEDGKQYTVQWFERVR